MRALSFPGSMLLATASVVASAAEPGLDPGKVIPRVVCRDDPGQSYALYLPSGYTTDRRWPVVYALEPAARGLLPVESFREAADELGYIIVGSNSSRNGPRTLAADALRAMWIDTRRRLSIDDRRVYLTGFSGGSRAAWALALDSGKVAGVIGCGAGAPPGSTPTAALPFSFVGIVGTTDMNHLELSRLDDRLEELGSAHRLLLFDGGHVWPPPAVSRQAVAWLELRAMADGLRERDPELIRRLLAEGLSRARALERGGQPHTASRAYRAIVDDFAGLAPTEEPEAAARRLGATREVKEAARRARRAANREASIRARLDERFEAIRSGPVVPSLPPDERQRWRRELRPVFRMLEASAGTDDALMGRRLEDYIVRRAVEEGGAYADREQAGKAVALGEVAVLAAPSRPGPHYNLACALAGAGQPGRALDALERAVALGFDGREHLERDPDLDLLREEPRFLALLAALR